MKKKILLLIIYIIIGELTKYILNVDELIYNSLSSQLTGEQMRSILKIQDKWKWISYLFLPIFILVKTSIIASILYIGTFFSVKLK
jgi:hypothetical protein